MSKPPLFFKIQLKPIVKNDEIIIWAEDLLGYEAREQFDAIHETIAAQDMISYIIKNNKEMREWLYEIRMQDFKDWSGDKNNV